jgi:hypothetical protein
VPLIATVCPKLSVALTVSVADPLHHPPGPVVAQEMESETVTMSVGGATTQLQEIGPVEQPYPPQKLVYAAQSMTSWQSEKLL